MTLHIREATADDAEACGNICYEAFRSIAEKHGFPPDMPSPEVATGLLAGLIARAGVHGEVAEIDGRIVGSNFAWEQASIVGVGPITIDPTTQNAGVGRALMESLLARVREIRRPGVRLVQAAYHGRSLSLYTKLGFDVREPLVALQGPSIDGGVAGCDVRMATLADVPVCEALHRRVHGFERTGELRAAIGEGTATVVERGGALTGYATGVGFIAHAVASTNDDLKALIAAAPSFDGPGFLLPARNADVFRWCLASGLRVVQPMTLMTAGLYNEPAGAYLPSVIY